MSQSTTTSSQSHGESGRIVFWALAGWTLLNLLQAAFTELFHDEAYFWVFSSKLSLVYFDQMPAVAVLIRAGEALLPGELGVRFFTVLLNTATLYGIYKLTGIRNPKLFFALALSLLVMQFAGFFTAPDTPLAFFLVCFLLAYRKFVSNPDWKWGLLLGIFAAAMGYSKYQGILFVLLLACVQLRLWKRPGFWLGLLATAGLLAIMPLTDPDTIRETLQFHLRDRGYHAWSLDTLWIFISGQLTVTAPAGLLLFWALFRYNPTDDFTRNIRRASILYLLVLIFLSLRNRVEANWAAPLYPPMIILAVQYFNGKERAWKWIKGLFLVSFSLTLLLRVYMVWDFLPSSLSTKIRPEIHGWKNWAKEVKNHTGDLPVVFWNSYQYPSKFWYYSGKVTASVNNHRYRKHQFSIMDMEKDLQGKPVWLAAGWDHTQFSDTIDCPDGRKLYLHKLDQFWSNPGVKIEASLPGGHLKKNSSITFPIRIFSDSPEEMVLRSPRGERVIVGWSILQSRRPKHVIGEGQDTTNLLGVSILKGIERNLTVSLPDSAGLYEIAVYLVTDNYIFANQSGKIPMVVE